MAGRAEHAGRSGSDLLLAIAVLLVATRLRFLIAAVWLGVEVKAGLAGRALIHVLTQTLVVELGILIAAAVVIFVGGGKRRELGRAFDLACVAVIPVVILHLALGVLFAVSNEPVDRTLALGADVIGGLWAAWIVTVAIQLVHAQADEVVVTRPARRAAWAASTLAAAGIAVQLLWIVQHPDTLRPIELGGAAPAFALPAIGPGGALGEKVSRKAGRVTVVDFWATWCGPCLRSMPHLDQVAAKHPEIDVLTINLDDAAEARKLFDTAGYKLALLADDGEVSERYGVVTIPHTVVIDGNGQLRRVEADLEAAIRDAE